MDKMNVDPVSGNEVPAGAMPHEVRDDIDAKLSEGEYVVPANVVRFFGVDFFENLMSKATKGLQKMEEGGRIGGEEAEMAEGGLMSTDFQTPELPEFLSDPTKNPFNEGSVTYETWYDASGNPVKVTYLNGQPQMSLEGLTKEPPAPTPAQSNGYGPDKYPWDMAPDAQPAEAGPPTQNFYAMSFEDLQRIGQDSEANNILKNDWVRKGAAVFGGLPASLGMGMIDLATQGKQLSEMRAAAMIAEERGNTSLAEELRARADEYVSKSESPFLKMVDKTGSITGADTYEAQKKAYGSTTATQTATNSRSSSSSSSSTPTKSKATSTQTKTPAAKPKLSYGGATETSSNSNLSYQLSSSLNKPSEEVQKNREDALKYGYKKGGLVSRPKN